VFALVVVVASLLIDAVNAIVDPRVRSPGRAAAAAPLSCSQGGSSG
jgi:hypothetical protein